MEVITLKEKESIVIVINGKVITFGLMPPQKGILQDEIPFAINAPRDVRVDREEVACKKKAASKGINNYNFSEEQIFDIPTDEALVISSPKFTVKILPCRPNAKHFRDEAYPIAIDAPRSVRIVKKEKLKYHTQKSSHRYRLRKNDKQS